MLQRAPTGTYRVAGGAAGKPGRAGLAHGSEMGLAPDRSGVGRDQPAIATTLAHCRDGPFRMM